MNHYSFTRRRWAVLVGVGIVTLIILAAHSSLKTPPSTDSSGDQQRHNTDPCQAYVTDDPATSQYEACQARYRNL